MIAPKCPICGKPLPPPVRKGGRPRKFCSRNCAEKAAYEYSKARGYRRHKKHRHVCLLCGKTFFSDRKDAHCCSISCGCAYSALMKHDASGVKVVMRSQELVRQREAQRRMLERCRETAPITVEERGGMRIETRGRAVCGFRATGLIHHI